MRRIIANWLVHRRETRRQKFIEKCIAEAQHPKPRRVGYASDDWEDLGYFDGR